MKGPGSPSVYQDREAVPVYKGVVYDGPRRHSGAHRGFRAGSVYDGIQPCCIRWKALWHNGFGAPVPQLCHITRGSGKEHKGVWYISCADVVGMADGLSPPSVAHPSLRSGPLLRGPTASDHLVPVSVRLRLAACLTDGDCSSFPRKGAKGAPAR